MKKHVIMIVFLLIFQNYLSAQDRFAFKAGINYSAFRDQPDLSLKRGILVGMSSGAAIHVAFKLAKTLKSGVIVAIAPDGGERYLTTELFGGD